MQLSKDNHHHQYEKKVNRKIDSYSDSNSNSASDTNINNDDHNNNDHNGKECNYDNDNIKKM